MMRCYRLYWAAYSLSSTPRGGASGPSSTSTRRHQITPNSTGVSTRDSQRYQEGFEPTSGQQVGLVETPDMAPVIQFHGNVLEHVKVPEIASDFRNMSDIEKNRLMEEKYGRDGPGDRLTKNLQATKRDMLQTQQDIDGLPWEIRWKKTLIPTQEEIIQDLRDRFELFEPDPIEREQQWYLHWRDRLYKSQKDRMIWPQGYTDYLDHYDETGRRRTLPSDQRWSDVSWKHLADANYRDRMWMVEQEERKAIHRAMDDEKQLLLEAEGKAQEDASIFMGIQYGVVDISPDQAYEALTGSADPLQIAKTKFKVEEYSAEYAWNIAQGKDLSKGPIDPVTGLPKSDRPPLPTGVTVEQAVAIEMQTNVIDQQFQDKAAAAVDMGASGPSEYGKQHVSLSKAAGDRPGLRAVTDRNIALVKERAAQLAGAASVDATNTTRINAPSAKLPSAPSDAIPSPTTAVATTAATRMMPRVMKQMEATMVAATSSTPTQEGFLTVPARPREAEPNVSAPEIFSAPESPELKGMPEWYVKSAVETGPMISTYGLTKDPLEQRADLARPEYYKRPDVTPSTFVTNDLTTQGENAFDEGKIMKQRSMPEASTGGFKPLPTYKDVTRAAAARERKLKLKQQAQVASASPAGEVPPTTVTSSSASPVPTPAATTELAVAEDDEDGVVNLTKSQRLAEERRRKSRKNQYDPDLLLPELPWETDAVIDPYRGVAEVDAVDFNKKDVEKTFRVYRDFMQQRLVEFANLSSQVSEDRCEKLLRDAIDRVRADNVGDHPTIDERMLDVIQIMFEGHLKQFISDWMSFRGGRKQDAQVLKSEADDCMRRSSAKCKLLGPSFTSFMQEMTANELESVRKNPVQRHVICVRDRKHEVIAKPFTRWISTELSDYVRTEWATWEQMDTHRTFAMRHLNEAKFKCPHRIEGVNDRTRDMLVEAFHAWCRGALAFHTGKHLFSMFLKYADTRFRGRAEDFFEESYELFQTYNNASEECGVYIPIPHSEPYYDFAEHEYHEGENGYHAELSGKLDKAERIWHSGTTIRWWPLFDETDFVHYYERRGRISQAYEMSDRCLENMNKKTHPSIHPFPERGKIFLEGAPLTQETAEHLWLRYMGDLYIEHSDFCNRTGKAQTAREHSEHAMNFYHIALRQAKERLPESWIAPLLTKAKLLTRSLGSNVDPVEYVKEVEAVAEKISALKPMPAHWVDRTTDMHYRIALFFYAAPAYAKIYMDEAQAMANVTADNQTLIGALDHRNKTGNVPERLARLEDCMDIVADTFRQKVLTWQAREQAEGDGFHLFNMLYFMLRVRPKSPEEVDTYITRFWPTYEYLYTQTALSARPRARMFQESIRRLCQIMLPGSVEHKQKLLKELKRLQEVMRHALDTKELARTIAALELNLKDPSKPPYVYGTETAHRSAMQTQSRFENPMVQVSMGSKDYSIMKAHEKKLKSALPEDPGSVAAKNPGDLDDTHHASRPAPTYRTTMEDAS